MRADARAAAAAGAALRLASPHPRTFGCSSEDPSAGCGRMDTSSNRPCRRSEREGGPAEGAAGSAPGRRPLVRSAARERRVRRWPAPPPAAAPRHRHPTAAARPPAHHGVHGVDVAARLLEAEHLAGLGGQVAQDDVRLGLALVPRLRGRRVWSGGEGGRAAGRAAVGAAGRRHVAGAWRGQAGACEHMHTQPATSRPARASSVRRSMWRRKPPEPMPAPRH